MSRDTSSTAMDSNSFSSRFADIENQTASIDMSATICTITTITSSNTSELAVAKPEVVCQSSRSGNAIPSTVEPDDTNTNNEQYYTQSLIKVAIKHTTNNDAFDHQTNLTEAKPDIFRSLSDRLSDAISKQSETDVVNIQSATQQQQHHDIEHNSTQRGRLLWKFVSENIDLVFRTTCDIEAMYNIKYEHYTQIPTLANIFDQLNQRRIARRHLIKKRVKYFSRNNEYRDAIKLLVQKEMLSRQAKMQRLARIKNRSLQRNTKHSKTVNKIVEIIRKESDLRSEKELQFLRRWMLKNLKGNSLLLTFLKKCSSEQQIAFMSKVQYNIYSRGDAIIRQNEIGTQYYVLLSGRANVFINDVLTNHPRVVASAKGKKDLYFLRYGVGAKVDTLRVGSEFGEYSLISDRPRSASVLCDPKHVCETMVISLKAFESALLDHANILINKMLDDAKKFYVISPDSVAPDMEDEMSTLPNEKKEAYKIEVDGKLRKLFQRFTRTKFKKGYLLQKQDQFCDNVYLVLKGNTTEYVKYKKTSSETTNTNEKQNENLQRTDKNHTIVSCAENKLDKIENFAQVRSMLMETEFKKQDRIALATLYQNYDFEQLSPDDTNSNNIVPRDPINIKKLYIGTRDEKSDFIIGAYNVLQRKKALTTIEITSDECEVIQISKTHFRMLLDKIMQAKLQHIGSLKHNHLIENKLPTNNQVRSHVNKILFEKDRECVEEVSKKIESHISDSDLFCNHNVFTETKRKNRSLANKTKINLKLNSKVGLKKLRTRTRTKTKTNTKGKLKPLRARPVTATVRKCVDEQERHRLNNRYLSEKKYHLDLQKVLQDVDTLQNTFKKDNQDEPYINSMGEFKKLNFASSSLGEFKKQIKNSSTKKQVVEKLDLEQVRNTMIISDGLINQLQKSRSQRTLDSARIAKVIEENQVSSTTHVTATPRNPTTPRTPKTPKTSKTPIISETSRTIITPRSPTVIKTRKISRCSSARLLSNYKNGDLSVVSTARTYMKPTVTQTKTQKHNGTATVQTVHKDKRSLANTNNRYTLILGTSANTDLKEYLHQQIGAASYQIMSETRSMTKNKSATIKTPKRHVWRGLQKRYAARDGSFIPMDITSYQIRDHNGATTSRISRSQSSKRKPIITRPSSAKLVKKLDFVETARQEYIKLNANRIQNVVEHDIRPDIQIEYDSDDNMNMCGHYK